MNGVVRSWPFWTTRSEPFFSEMNRRPSGAKVMVVGPWRPPTKTVSAKLASWMTALARETASCSGADDSDGIEQPTTREATANTAMSGMERHARIPAITCDGSATSPGAQAHAAREAARTLGGLSRATSKACSPGTTYVRLAKIRFERSDEGRSWAYNGSVAASLHGSVDPFRGLSVEA